MAEAKSKKKQRRSVPTGQLHVQATFNNTIITFADSKGNALTAASAGACGFRGSKKGTAYAAQIAAEKATEAAKSTYGLRTVDVFVKGVGLGRDAAIHNPQPDANLFSFFDPKSKTDRMNGLSPGF